MARLIRKVTASIEFSPDDKVFDEEGAIQSLGENVLDGCLTVTFEYEEDERRRSSTRRMREMSSEDERLVVAALVRQGLTTLLEDPGWIEYLTTFSNNEIVTTFTILLTDIDSDMVAKTALQERGKGTEPASGGTSLQWVINGNRVEIWRTTSTIEALWDERKKVVEQEPKNRAGWVAQPLHVQDGIKAEVIAILNHLLHQTGNQWIPSDLKLKDGECMHGLIRLDSLV